MWRSTAWWKPCGRLWIGTRFDPERVRGVSKVFLLAGIPAVLAGCGSAPGVQLGEFDSKVLKISLFRIVPAVEGGRVQGEKVRGRFKGLPEYSVMLSHGWLLAKGPRVHEAYLKPVGPMVVGFNREGTPDGDMRRFVGVLLRNGLRELPAADPEPTAEEIEGLLRLAEDPEKVEEWVWARILVVESDHGRRVIMPYRFRDRKNLLEKYRRLERVLAGILVLRAPAIGRFRVVENLGDE